MILTGREIEREWRNGRIVIDPFTPEQMNPNSYNFRLGRLLRVYRPGVLETRCANEFEDIHIDDSGLTLEPGTLYLAHTVERLGSEFYAPTFAARSSVARLGLFINLSASLGDIGYVGQWTLQLYPVNRIRVYPGMNIGQMMWWRPVGRIKLYSGKYQGSVGPRPSAIHVDLVRQLARQRLPNLRATVDPQVVGPKFATLSRLSQQVAVPDAFCVPVGEFERALRPDQRAQLRATFADLKATVGAFFSESTAKIQHLLRSLRVPDDLREHLAQRVAELTTHPDQALAVRSSAVEEDGLSSSMAGIYDTVLGVVGIEAVVAAVERCWASYYSVTAVAARIRTGDVTWAPRMAVIVQRQIAPVIAGVAFAGGADTPTGADVTVEYVHGLADGLVAGITQAERTDSAALAADGLGELTGGQRSALTQVVALARAVREVEQAPVDVEWAADADGVHLVQARPQTAALPSAPGCERPYVETFDLYRGELPPTLALGSTAAVYASYTAKRGPAYRLAASRGIRVGRGWVVAFNGAGLRSERVAASLRKALEASEHGECVVDVTEHLRQLIMSKDEVVKELQRLTGAPDDKDPRIHTAIVREFIRGELGVISRLVDDGIAVEFAEEGLMALNRGTAVGRSAIVVNRRSVLDGSVEGAVDHRGVRSVLADVTQFTEVMASEYGDVAIEWVVDDGRPIFVDYTVTKATAVTFASSQSTVLSTGTATGPVLALTDDDVLARLSIGPAVSVERTNDIAEHDTLARILRQIADMPSPPIVHARRPYAVLSVLIGHVAGFVFDEGSLLGHLPIMLREAGTPAVVASGFNCADEVTISGGAVRAVAR